MSIFDIFNKAPETKASPFVDTASSTYNFTTRNIEAFYKEGYMKNSVVYKCVNKVARAWATLDVKVCYKVMEDGKEVIKDYPASPAQDLLKQPNPRYSQKKFIEQVAIDYLVAGEMFLARDDTKNEPTELWRADPQKMQVKGGSSQLVEKYVYNNNKSYPVTDKLKGTSSIIFHFFMANPCDDWRGQSPLCSVGDWVDVLNEAAYWNASLLHNGGNLSGVVGLKGASMEAVKRLSELWKTTYEGAKNAGKTAIINSEIDYKPISATPKDMDFEKSIKTGARAIADVYGVPFPLVSPDSTTFNNMSAALEDFYEDTVLPLADSFYEDFGNWLLPQFKDYKEKKPFFVVVEDSLPALEARNQRKSNRIISEVNGRILSSNEGREALGYERRKEDGADDILVSSSIIPIDEVSIEEAVDEEMKKLTSLESKDGKTNKKAT